MKILFVTRKFPPQVGGMELFARDLSTTLSSEVELKLISWGYKVRGIYLLPALIILFLKSFWSLLVSKVDVIHMQDGVLAPQGWLLSKIFHKPYVVVIHGLDITYKNKLFKAIVPWAVKKADRVICISESAAEECTKRGVISSKINIITLAVNDDIYGQANRTDLISELKLEPNAKILLTVGRLVKRKGVAWFIENVLPSLVSQFPNLVYLVAGEGPEKQTILDVSKKHGLASNVILLGRAEANLLAAAYNGCDIFVMPNIAVPNDIEGFGLVSLEAAMCARPIVASELEGIKDAIANGKNGYLIEAANQIAYQYKISQLLNNEAGSKSFGQKSRQYTLRNNQWPVIAKQYIQIYQSLQFRGQNT